MGLGGLRVAGCGWIGGGAGSRARLRRARHDVVAVVRAGRSPCPGGSARRGCPGRGCGRRCSGRTARRVRGSPRILVAVRGVRVGVRCRSRGSRRSGPMRRVAGPGPSRAHRDRCGGRGSDCGVRCRRYGPSDDRDVVSGGRHLYRGVGAGIACGRMVRADQPRPHGCRIRHERRGACCRERPRHVGIDRNRGRACVATRCSTPLPTLTCNSARCVDPCRCAPLYTAAAFAGARRGARSRQGGFWPRCLLRSLPDGCNSRWCSEWPCRSVAACGNCATTPDSGRCWEVETEHCVCR